MTTNTINKPNPITETDKIEQLFSILSHLNSDMSEIICEAEYISVRTLIDYQNRVVNALGLLSN